MSNYLCVIKNFDFCYGKKGDTDIRSMKRSKNIVLLNLNWKYQYEFTMFSALRNYRFLNYFHYDGIFFCKPAFMSIIKKLEKILT